MLSMNEMIKTQYAGKIVFGKVIKTLDTPFQEPIYKIELDSWILDTKQAIVECIYLSESELTVV